LTQPRITGKSKEILVSDGLSLENLLPGGKVWLGRGFAELCTWVSVGCTQGTETCTVLPSESFFLLFLTLCFVDPVCWDLAPFNQSSCSDVVHQKPGYSNLGCSIFYQNHIGVTESRY